MVKIRTILVVFVLLGFAFLLTQQRMETKNHDLKLQKLQKEIVSLESAKRDMTLKIQKEKNRLNLLAMEKVGIPISLNDVVSVPVQSGVLSRLNDEVSHSSSPERLFSALLSLFTRL